MFKIDPREAEYPWQSTYAYYSNSPISVIDYLGGGSWHSTFFIQYEFRVSCGLTHSQAIGIMIDTHKNVAIYHVGTFGVGLILGGSTGWSVGVLTSDNVSETSGWGFTIGALATVADGVGVSGGIEYNNAIEQNKEGSLSDIDFGVTFSLPIQIGALGLQAGVYTEGSYAKVLEIINLEDAFYKLYENIEKELNIKISEEEKKTLKSASIKQMKTQTEENIKKNDNKIMKLLDQWEAGTLTDQQLNKQLEEFNNTQQENYNMLETLNNVN